FNTADPVEALRVARVEGDGLFKAGNCGFGFIKLEVNLAKLMAQGGILRPFVDHLQQQSPGDDVLLGGNERLNEIRARRPMTRIKFQGLKIIRDSFLWLSRPAVGA